jgi:tyrosine-protein phosphatase YwqE
MWADRWPQWLDGVIEWLQGMKLTVILAHPERMRAVQDEPRLAERLTDRGVLLQGNLQCFADRPESHTRRTAERLLLERRFFVLGSDCHGVEGLKTRLIGLNNATDLVGESAIDKLTRENPRQLLPPAHWNA